MLSLLPTVKTLTTVQVAVFSPLDIQFTIPFHGQSLLPLRNQHSLKESVYFLELNSQKKSLSQKSFRLIIHAGITYYEMSEGLPVSQGGSSRSR